MEFDFIFVFCVRKFINMYNYITSYFSFVTKLLLQQPKNPKQSTILGERERKIYRDGERQKNLTKFQNHQFKNQAYFIFFLLLKQKCYFENKKKFTVAFLYKNSPFFFFLFVKELDSGSNKIHNDSPLYV